MQKPEGERKTNAVDEILSETHAFWRVTRHENGRVSFTNSRNWRHSMDIVFNPRTTNEGKMIPVVDIVVTELPTRGWDQEGHIKLIHLIMDSEEIDGQTKIEALGNNPKLESPDKIRAVIDEARFALEALWINQKGLPGTDHPDFQKKVADLWSEDNQFRVDPLESMLGVLRSQVTAVAGAFGE